MNLVYLFDATIQCLIMILVIWTIFFMKILNQRLADAELVASMDSNKDCPRLFTDKLLEWKRQYSLISQLVDRFNSLFGFTVLLFLYYRFVSVISGAFMIWCDLMKEEQEDFSGYYYISTFISEFSKLCMIVYICHILQLEVISFKFIFKKSLS